MNVAKQPKQVHTMKIKLYKYGQKTFKSWIFVQEHYKFKSTVWGDIFLNSSDTILHSYKLQKFFLNINWEDLFIDNKVFPDHF